MKFKQWFEEQCGKRPRKMQLSDERLIDYIQTGINAHKELTDRLQYDAMFKSALYAWQIKDQEKE